MIETLPGRGWGLYCFGVFATSAGRTAAIQFIGRFFRSKNLRVTRRAVIGGSLAFNQISLENNSKDLPVFNLNGGGRKWGAHQWGAHRGENMRGLLACMAY